MATRNQPKPKLTYERLREVLDYNPATGIFRWKVTQSNRALAGSAAGCPEGALRYWKIKIDGRQYRAHQLAWFYVHGEWPDGDLDHKDTVKHHNWISNLRPATRSQNGSNTQLRCSNTSGFKGVSFDKRYEKWRATIKKDYRAIHIGCFDTPEAAHAAYVAKAKELFGDFANAGN